MNRVFGFVMGMALLACFGRAAEKENTAQRIEQLLAKVTAADCQFIRNGSAHTGKEAAEHMRRKYDHFRKQITTPEEFVEKCATKSELSGKAYTVKLPDGKEVPARQWMLGLLAELRKSGTDPKPTPAGQLRPA